jgi:hypothetical protein
MKQNDIEKYLIDKDNKYYYYYIPWSIINNIAHNWSRNRPPDENKIEEMYNNYILNNHLHFFLHLAFHEDEKLIIYDGIHRSKVLQKLINGTNNQEIIDKKIFISIIWNANHDDIYEDFKNLNKANIVPDIYIYEAQYNETFKKKLNELINLYKIQYKAFIKTSNNPKPPHFEINQFKNEITLIYDKLPKEKKNIEYIKEILIKYNIIMKNSAENFLKKNSIQWKKCEKDDFWLFIEKPININNLLKL